MMEIGSGQNHGEDHASTMKHESAINTAFGFRNQSADEGLFGCAPDAAWGTVQARHERKDEGVHLCLSCRRPLKNQLDDDEGQKSDKTFPWMEQTAIWLTMTAKRVMGGRTRTLDKVTSASATVFL